MRNSRPSPYLMHLTPAILLLLCGLLLAAQAAAQQADAPERRPYNAGFRIVDVTVEDRTVTTAIWYPTEEEEKPLAYGSERSTNRGTVAVDAAPAGEDKRLPLLLYSHGFGGSAIGYTYLAEPLARRGWIVAAPDHTDAVNASRIRTGRNPSDARRLSREARKLVQSGTDFDFDKYAYRLEDVRAVLDHVLEMEAFSGPIDRQKIAIGGHSFGGYTAVGVCGALEKYHDDRFRAIILHSPGIWMYSEQQFSRIDLPVLYMLGEKETSRRRIGRTKLAWAERVLRAIQAPGYYAEVKDGTHFSFNTRQRDGLFSRWLSGSPEEFKTVRQYSFDFLDHHLLGRPGTGKVIREGSRGISRQRVFRNEKQ
jgi:pimeloyl-ACP methyl ester carboxylesterase